MSDQEQISIAEAVSVGAHDPEFYGRFFFAKTVRQGSAPFHKDMDDKLYSEDRYVSLKLFRGAAKTTKLRIFVSARIAYAVSRTIIFVGKSQDHARRSVEWLMKQVEYNSLWAQSFGLRKGTKWTSEEIEIYHGIDEVPIRVIAVGITGSTRGINVDDYRPDLIVVDDPCDEENTATAEQRDKISDYFFGSLQNSLAPRSEAPAAKMVLLQTLLNDQDLISLCEQDPMWKSLTVSCFTENGESSWPSRWTTQELLREKEGFIARGKLHLWMREMECTLVDGTLSSFQLSKLQYWEVLPDWDELTFFLGIDPVPPPSERELARGLKGKDSEVHAVVARRGRGFFLVDYEVNKGHEPDWSVKTFFELKARYAPRLAKVESIAYQRTLKWLLEKTMAARGEWMQIRDTNKQGKVDNRKKSYRIIDTIGSVVADRRLYVHRTHTQFIEQYQNYPNVQHEDVLEAVAMAIDAAQEWGSVYEGDFTVIEREEAAIPDLGEWRACP